MEERFIKGSELHRYILLITLLSTIAFIFFGRRFSGEKIQTWIGNFLASVLILNYIAYIIYRIHSGFWEIKYDLPMEFCNWSMIVTSIALLNQNRVMAELSYFWVMAGSINGVITPDLQVSFPHIYFFIFFIAHSGLVLASAYIVFGLKLYPRKGAVIRAVLYSQIYFLTAFLVNYFLGGNYGYTMAKPNGASALDHFGPWPYYLIVLQVLGVLIFCILYLPFYFLNRNSK